MIVANETILSFVADLLFKVSDALHCTEVLTRAIVANHKEAAGILVLRVYVHDDVLQVLGLFSALVVVLQ